MNLNLKFLEGNSMGGNRMFEWEGLAVVFM